MSTRLRFASLCSLVVATVIQVVPACARPDGLRSSSAAEWHFGESMSVSSVLNAQEESKSYDNIVVRPVMSI